MALQAGYYTMRCWHSTRNTNEMNRPKLIHQCLQLIKALQAHFTNGELAIPSRDEKDRRKGIEICVFYRPGLRFFDDIASFLSHTAAEESLDYHNFVQQHTAITRHFNDDEIKNISLLAAPVPDGLTEEKIAEIGTSFTEHHHGFKPSSDWSESIPVEQRASQPFHITRRCLQRIHEKEGGDLSTEIESLLDGFRAAEGQPKTAWQIFTMLAEGVVPIGDYTVLESTVYYLIIVATWVGDTAVVGVGAGLSAVIAVLEWAGFIGFDDARNVLLFINDTSSDVLPLRDHIENGRRRLVPEAVPATVPSSDFVSACFFIYEKDEAVGSAFGVSLRGGQGEYSIGMDCPNSFFDGRNAIEVCTGNDVGKATQMALKSGCMQGRIDYPRVDVKIADPTDSVNWGRVIAMGNL